jgi:hypothetical protein
MEKIIRPANLQETKKERIVRDELILKIGRDVQEIGTRNHCQLEVKILTIKMKDEE